MQRSARLWSHPEHVVPTAPQAVTPIAAGATQALPLQQPVAHDAAVHVHTPPVQTWPAAHGAPAPQRHAPFSQRSADAAHTPHALPPAPHWFVPCEVMHWLAEQQPPGQLEPSQTQVPPTQRWPAAQTLPLPHAQAPLRQVSARRSQLSQTRPPVAHAVVPGALTHMFPAQHPEPQLAALHTHAPPTHAWPGAQAAPVPHAQAPSRQASARSGSQAPHAPPAPHRAKVIAAVPTQAPALQHWSAPQASHPAQTLLLQAPVQV